MESVSCCTTFFQAIEQSHHNCLITLHQLQLDIWTGECSLECAKKCFLPGIQFALDYELLIEPIITVIASSQEYWPLLYFLVEKKIKWHARTMIPMRMSLSCMKFLHQNGAPWHPSCLYYYIQANRMDLFVYAHENGCPWHPRLVEESIKRRYTDLIYYVLTHEYGPIHRPYLLKCQPDLFEDINMDDDFWRWLFIKGPSYRLEVSSLVSENNKSLQNKVVQTIYILEKQAKHTENVLGTFNVPRDLIRYIIQSYLI